MALDAHEIQPCRETSPWSVVDGGHSPVPYADKNRMIKVELIMDSKRKTNAADFPLAAPVKPLTALELGI